MSKEEYIRQCGGRTSKDLSANQILSYFLRGNGGKVNMVSASIIKQGRLCGKDIDRAKAIAMLRQAFDLDMTLEIHYIMGEGVLLHERDSIPGSSLLMKLKEGQAI